MTKEVLVTIEGLQKGIEEDSIITSASGTYHFTKGKHYIQYDEPIAESNTVSKNIIKIEPSQVILSKKLLQMTEMVFDLKEITQTAYHTPYGSLIFDIKTSSIQINEEPEKIVVIMEYALSAEESHVSDNSITITVTSLT